MNKTFCLSNKYKHRNNFLFIWCMLLQNRFLFKSIRIFKYGEKMELKCYPNYSIQNFSKRANVSLTFKETLNIFHAILNWNLC